MSDMSQTASVPGQGHVAVTSDDPEYYYETLMLMIGLISCSFFVGAFLKKIKFQYFQETAATVTLGALAGLITLAAGSGALDFERHIRLSTSFFYLVLLPPIIFEAGYSMRRVNFFKNFHSILSLAFLGTAFSTFACGALVYLGGLFTFPVSPLEALVYGALISATDPVSVLATLAEVPIDKNLYILIFGESALNDAVAVILYRFISSFALPGAVLNAGTFFTTSLLAIWVFTASVLLGYLMGMILAFVLKHFDLEHETATQVALVFMFAQASYLVAEWIHLSGIVSILFCGISMAHYVQDNMTPEAVANSKSMLRVYAYVSETAIFLYLGLALVAFGSNEPVYRFDFIAVALIAMLVSRVHVFIICAIANIFRKTNKITFKQQIFLWYAGLRGALCFVMALQLSQSDYFRDAFKHVILATTLATVFATIIIMGAFNMSVLNKCKLILTEAEVQAQHEEDAKRKSADAPAKRVFGLALNIKSWDKRYIKPFLTVAHNHDGMQLLESGPSPDLEATAQANSIPKQTKEGEMFEMPLYGNKVYDAENF